METPELQPSEYDWKKFIPYKHWVLVKADPRITKTASGIELPDQLLGIERVMEGTGRALKVGSTCRKTAPELEPGVRICFRGFLKDCFKEFETDADGCVIFLLRVEDVLAIVEDDVQMGEIR